MTKGQGCRTLRARFRGSSRSPTISSSAVMSGGEIFDMFCGVSVRNAPCLPM